MNKAPSWIVVFLGLLGLVSLVFQGVLYSQTRTVGNRIDDKCTKNADGEFAYPAAAEWYNTVRDVEPVFLLSLALSIVFSIVFIVKAFRDEFNGCLENSFGRFMQCLMILLPHLLLVLAVGGIAYAPFTYYKETINPNLADETVEISDEECADVNTDMLVTSSWIALISLTVYSVSYLGYDMGSSKTKHGDDDVHHRLMDGHYHDPHAQRVINVHHVKNGCEQQPRYRVAPQC